MDSTTSTSRLSVSSPQSGPSGGIQKGRQRTITACLTCRRRKVKCDHTQPVCTPCQRGGRVCTYVNPQPVSQAPSRVGTGSRVSRTNLRSGQEEIRSRLERLEQLLERAISGGGNISKSPDAKVTSTGSPSDVDQGGSALPIPRCETLSADGYDGALLLEAEGGQSRWVSSLHYALLADEVQSFCRSHFMYPALIILDSRCQNAAGRSI
jgi:hypothetical protein